MHEKLNNTVLLDIINKICTKLLAKKRYRKNGDAEMWNVSNKVTTWGI